MEGFGTAALVNPTSLLEAKLGEGKVWFHPPEPGPAHGKTEQGILAAYASALGVQHMGQGHVPSEVVFADEVVRHKGEMFQRWGLLFLMDTGMSRGVGDSAGAILQIVLDARGKTVRTSALCANGKETALWDDVTRPDSGRADPCAE
jgi:hypothetical protein